MKVPVVNAGRPIVFVAGVLWIVSFAISTSSLRAQEYEIYKQLSGTGATDPRGPLIQGPDGLYGTSFTGGSGECDPQGGLPGCGTIYRLEPDGDVKVLHEFQVGEGRPTIYPLLRASDGNLYGTTIGSSFSCPCGTVYRLDPEGNFDTIHTFQGDDGRNPSSGLIEPVDGELWGTTTGGGTSTACTLGCGTVYRMHFDGGFTTMHSLDEADDEGRSPTGNLVLASDGDIYGVTAVGGTGSNGTFFKITLNGNWTTIAPLPALFYYLSNGLIQASNGDFIGTTYSGGEFIAGSIYRLSPTGEAEILHSMADDGTDGYYPLAPVVEADDGFFYGATYIAGAHSRGTLFRVDLDKNFEVVHDFDEAPDGMETRAGMLRAADGNLYGTTSSESGGLVYRLNVGPPPVYFCPTSPVRRDQMAVFLLKIVHGAAHIPPDCAGIFGDVPCSSIFAPWIEQLAAEGITAGCAGGFCPVSPVSRAQMSVFLLKLEHGSAYVPSSCHSAFADVACPSLFASWIEQLYAEHITGGCGGTS